MTTIPIKPKPAVLRGREETGWHTKATSSHPAYPDRSVVPDSKVDWSSDFPEYAPVEFTAKVVLDNDRTVKTGGWADPAKPTADDLKAAKTHMTASGHLELVNDFPRNPIGRTGMVGRGLLGKWGANHAADPMVTRLSPVDGRLQMVVIKRKDTGDWALPGGMVDAGELVSATLKREFGEEAMGNFTQSDSERKDLADQLNQVFAAQGMEIYRGYVDDPRNTDQSWMETVAVWFHCEPKLGDRLVLEAADDAVGVRWLTIDTEDGHLPSLYASHETFVREVLRRHREDEAATILKRDRSRIGQPRKSFSLKAFLMRCVGQE